MPEPVWLESTYQNSNVFQIERAKKAAQGWQVASVKEEAHDAAGQATRIVVWYRRVGAPASQVQPPSTFRPPLRYPAGSVPESRQPSLPPNPPRPNQGQKRQSRATPPPPVQLPTIKGVTAPSAKQDKSVVDEQAIDEAIERLLVAHSTLPSQPATPQSESEILIDDDGFSLSDERMTGILSQYEKIQPSDDLLPPPPLPLLPLSSSASQTQPMRTTTRTYNNANDFLRDRPKMEQQGWKVVEEVEEWKPPFNVFVTYQRNVAPFKPIPPLQPAQFQPRPYGPPPRRETVRERQQRYQAWMKAHHHVQMAVGSAGLLVILLLCIGIGTALYTSAQSNQDQASTTSATQARSSPVVKASAVTKKSTSKPKPPTPPVYRSLRGVILGGTQSAFTAKYGEPSENVGALYFYQNLQVGVVGAGYLVNTILIGIPQGQIISMVTGIAECNAVIPSDSVYQREFSTYLSGPQSGYAAIYVSKALSRVFPTSDFTDVNHELITPGTFTIAYNYLSNNSSEFLDCEIDLGVPDYLKSEMASTSLPTSAIETRPL